MRSTTLVAALLVGASTCLAAQRAHQLELGGFGSFTRYDHLMALDSRIGAGARIGYAFTDILELEAEFGLAQPHTRNQFGFTSVRWGAASLILTVAPSRRNRPYLLGGYTRIDYGSAASAPYDFADHAVHGAIGNRFFVMYGVALRVEGAPSSRPRPIAASAASGQAMSWARSVSQCSPWGADRGMPIVTGCAIHRTPVLRVRPAP